MQRSDEVYSEAWTKEGRNKRCQQLMGQIFDEMVRFGPDTMLRQAISDVERGRAIAVSRELERLKLLRKDLVDEVDKLRGFTVAFYNVIAGLYGHIEEPSPTLQASMESLRIDVSSTSEGVFKAIDEVEKAYADEIAKL